MNGLRRLALATAGVALLGAAPAVGASTGVSIDVGRIDVTEPLAPGGEYRLPTFGVRNPGTEPTTYQLVVGYVDGQPDALPPESWFSFDPGDLTLAPNGSHAVVTRVVVPPDAMPGTYAALIGPQIVSTGEGAQVGAAAAVRLTFTVSEAGGLEGWLRMLWRLLVAYWWLVAVVALAAFAFGLRILRRRFTFAVERRS